ncbi:hypothetical protein ACI2KT_33435 [Ensifer adhaerens]|uniref:Membrane-anchored protein n=1 Tax=Ensifer adhaerens TaxID=106592 RepID=A0A9Q9DBC2_ENSAD|nr:MULTISPECIES: hypothetical protein [Ensifer]KSV62483.1 hypothetical protein N185_08715 [Sinorhizobium sp. GW3]KSV72514.1 hypothetical protein N182_29410 [Sinorhizobium sp. GL2]OWZ91559.1 hypothetical protein B9J07_21085 [Sinorhizobium sp. LM21]ANK75763.1 hypothetical protein FA04_24130 [Ensifer adhaerens]KDP73567.1 membrane protein [Ensifer adhaerens]
MSVAADKPDVAPEQNNAKPLKGRVDAIDQGRVFGWAFDPETPEKRLAIRVLLDGKVIAEALADRNRPDLKRNGIGDGNHAFEIALPEMASARSGELVVLAATGKGGELPLRVPKPDEQAAEALIAAPLAKVLDKLDVLMAAQRQLQVSQRSALRSKVDDGDEAESPGLAAISDDVANLRGEITQRLTDLDVHLMRLDGVIAGMEKSLNALKQRSNGDLKPAFLLLFVLAGFAAGAILSVFLRT